MVQIMSRLKKLETKLGQEYIHGLAFVNRDEGGVYVSRAKASSKDFKKTLEATITGQTESGVLHETSEWFKVHIDPVHGEFVIYYGDYDLA